MNVSNYLLQRLDLDVGAPHTATNKTHIIPRKHSDFCIFNGDLVTVCIKSSKLMYIQAESSFQSQIYY